MADKNQEKELLKSFADEVHRRCGSINSAVTMVEMGQGPAADLADLRVEAHGIKGTAAVLGLDELADRAARLEEDLIDASMKDPIDPTLAGRIQKATAAIEDGARAALDSISDG